MGNISPYIYLLYQHLQMLIVHKMNLFYIFIKYMIYIRHPIGQDLYNENIHPICHNHLSLHPIDLYIRLYLRNL